MSWLRFMGLLGLLWCCMSCATEREKDLNKPVFKTFEYRVLSWERGANQVAKQKEVGAYLTLTGDAPITIPADKVTSVELRITLRDDAPAGTQVKLVTERGVLLGGALVDQASGAPAMQLTKEMSFDNKQVTFRVTGDYQVGPIQLTLSTGSYIQTKTLQLQAPNKELIALSFQTGNGTSTKLPANGFARMTIKATLPPGTPSTQVTLLTAHGTLGDITSTAKQMTVASHPNTGEAIFPITSDFHIGDVQLAFQLPGYQQFANIQFEAPGDNNEPKIAFAPAATKNAPTDPDFSLLADGAERVSITVTLPAGAPSTEITLETDHGYLGDPSKSAKLQTILSHPATRDATFVLSSDFYQGDVTLTVSAKGYRQIRKGRFNPFAAGQHVIKITHEVKGMTAAPPVMSGDGITQMKITARLPEGYPPTPIEMVTSHGTIGNPAEKLSRATLTTDAVTREAVFWLNSAVYVGLVSLQWTIPGGHTRLSNVEFTTPTTPPIAFSYVLNGANVAQGNARLSADGVSQMQIMVKVSRGPLPAKVTLQTLAGTFLGTGLQTAEASTDGNGVAAFVLVAPLTTRKALLVASAGTARHEDTFQLDAACPDDVSLQITGAKVLAPDGSATSSVKVVARKVVGMPSQGLVVTFTAKDANSSQILNDIIEGGPFALDAKGEATAILRAPTSEMNIELSAEVGCATPIKANNQATLAIKKPTQSP